MILFRKNAACARTNRRRNVGNSANSFLLGHYFRKRASASRKERRIIKLIIKQFLADESMRARHRLRIIRSSSPVSSEMKDGRSARFFFVGSFARLSDTTYRQFTYAARCVRGQVKRCAFLSYRLLWSWLDDDEYTTRFENSNCVWQKSWWKFFSG